MAAELVIRRATAADVDAAAGIVYKSFRELADAAGAFSGTAETPQIAHGVVSAAVAHCHAVVAERDGVICGFNSLVTSNAPLYGIGPVAVDVGCQGGGVGRALMGHLAEHVDAQGGGARTSVRLTVDAYNSVGFSLYIKLGYQMKDTLTVLERRPDARSSAVPPSGYSVREMAEGDVACCAALAERVARCGRAAEITSAVHKSTSGPYAHTQPAWVVVHDGAVVGYTTGLSYGGHTVCESTEACIALISAVQKELAGRGVVPRIAAPFATHPDVGRWCLENGWRVLKHLMLLVRGHYEPVASGGCFIPTVDG